MGQVVHVLKCSIFVGVFAGRENPCSFHFNIRSARRPWWRHQVETFPRYWPFVRGIHRSPVNSPHKGQWREALMFSLICAWTNGWTHHQDAGDLRHHYDVTVMYFNCCFIVFCCDLLQAILTTSSRVISLVLVQVFDFSNGSETTLRTWKIIHMKLGRWYNHNKINQNKTRVHVSWGISYVIDNHYFHRYLILCRRMMKPNTLSYNHTFCTWCTYWCWRP